MNPPYPPAPGSPYQPGGYPQQPGYPPPPQRQGMGCFAKGCITVVIVLMLLGVLIGGVSWYMFNSFKVFISPTPVAVRSFQATDEQFQDVTRRYTEFVQALNAGRAATFSLSADDLNTLIARNPDFKNKRGRIFVDIKDSEIIAEASFPIEDSNTRRRSGGQKMYFNGRVSFGASYTDGEAAMQVRKVESLDGKPMSDFLLRFFNRLDLGQLFNQAMRDEQRKGSAWAEAMEKVDKIVVENGHIVATAKEGQPATNPVPLPGESPRKVDKEDDDE